jgi:hypothetical protein
VLGTPDRPFGFQVTVISTPELFWKVQKQPTSLGNEGANAVIVIAVTPEFMK